MSLPAPLTWRIMSACSRLCSNSAINAWTQQLPRYYPTATRAYASMVSFPLAQTGEGISECELLKWHVKEGDAIHEFDRLCEVQSDKATIEITSRYSGVIARLCHAAGAIVKVGEPLVDIQLHEDDPAAATATTAGSDADTTHLSSGIGTTTISPASPGPFHAGLGTASEAGVPPTVPSDMKSPGSFPLPAAGQALHSLGDPPHLMSDGKRSLQPHAHHTRMASRHGTSAGLGDSNSNTSGSGHASAAEAGSRHTSSGGAVKASPALRHFAKEQGIDLAVVAATGESGRTTREDVLRHIQAQGSAHHPQTSPQAAITVSPSAGPPTARATAGMESDACAIEAAARLIAACTHVRPPPHLANAFPLPEASMAAGGGLPTSGAASSGTAAGTADRRVALRGYARSMVRHMTDSLAVPQFHFCDEVIMDGLLHLRGALKDDPLLKGVKLTFLPFLVKALSTALHNHPTLNSSLSADGAELLIHGSHNIGVAMATPQGLVVPNVKQVQHKSVTEIAHELAALQVLAAANRLPPEALSGGTITVSNIGSIGGTYATPRTSPPEVAIVALGRVQRLPRYEHPAPSHAGAACGALVPRAIMTVSWGADHRVVDGAALAAFSNTWRRLLEDPGRMLLHLR